MKKILLFCLMSFIPSSLCRAKPICVCLNADMRVPQVEFAVKQIREALQKSGYLLVEANADTTIQLKYDANDLEPQCYYIRKDEMGQITVTGGDATGLMYGGLELAEMIRLDKGVQKVKDTQGKPYIEKRGLKFNIPLDARTPSYDDTGDAAQENYAEMWNFEFWKEFFDNMARHRYNTLTLWNPHPFPSMVKVKEYPDAALDNVCVTTLKPVAQPGEWNEPQLVAAKVVENLKIVKKMTIDEKINYWRKVMRYAKNRGIEIYFITWNVCMNSVAPALKDKSERQIQDTLKGKYGVTNSQTNPQTIKYLRASVRDFILTYPDLAGIGVTAGENMKSRNDEFSKEKWLWNTYGMGILDAKKMQPDRQVKFIHRFWQTDVGDIIKEWKDYPDLFELSFKYSRARLYSSPKPPFAKQEGILDGLRKHNLKCWWNLRNDDIFCHRWADPDYVREFILNFPYEQTAGYHMGSDGYVWGREFASLEPETPRQLEIVKHWYNFMLWGRLGYNPNLDRTFFEKVLANKFPEVDASLLYDTWAASSKIIPQVNRFHWRDWDYMWAVEGCIDAQRGFHNIEQFIECGTMEESGIISIAEYVKAILNGQQARRPSGGQVRQITPIQVADNLDTWADKALEGTKQIRSKCTPSKELRQTLTDIESMAYLGKYYAAKIRGAVEYAMYQVANYSYHKDRAIEHLTEAVDRWKSYADRATSQYKPQLLARTGHLDWWKLFEDVKIEKKTLINTD